MVLWWFSVSFAQSPAACAGGDADACAALFAEAVSVVVDAAGDRGGFDPRYAPAMHTYAGLLCAAGDAEACRWARAPHRDAGWPDGVVRVRGRAFPLPSGGWSSLALDGELGETGRYIPGAKDAALYGDAVVFGDRDHGSLLSVSPEGVEWLPEPDNVCGGSIGQPPFRVVNEPPCMHGATQRVLLGPAGERWPLPLGTPVVVTRPYAVVGSTRVDLRSDTRSPLPSGQVLDVGADGRVLLRGPGGDLQQVGNDGVVHDVGVGSVEAARWLPDGRMVAWRRPAELTLLDPQGGEERRWVFPEEAVTRPSLRVHPDGRSIAVVEVGQSSVVQLEGQAQLGELSWPEGSDVDLRKAGPPDPAAFRWRIVDPTGAPVEGVFLEGRVSDAEGEVSQRYVVGSVPTVGAFVDGVPRDLRIDIRAHRAVLPPLKVLPRPEGLDPDTIAAWPRGLRRPLSMRRLGADALVVPGFIPAEVEGQRLWATDGSDLTEARALFSIDLATDSAWTSHPLTTLSVVDEAGRPLVGVRVRVDHPLRSYVAVSDLKGHVPLWDADEATVQPAARGVASRREGSALVLTGPPAAPRPWTPHTPADVDGIWRGVDGEEQVAVRIEGSLARLAGTGSNGRLRWLHDGERLILEDPPLVLRRPTPRRRNTRRWFTGHASTEAGTCMVETIDDSGRPTKRTVYDDARDADRRNNWLFLGGPLDGLQLERGVPTTVRMEGWRITWTYIGRERCGRVRCAVVEQRTDGTTGRLVIEPDTLHLHRFDGVTRRGELQVRRAWGCGDEP